MADQDELERRRQQAIADARARIQQRASASIVGASDASQRQMSGPPVPSDLDQIRAAAIQRATAASESARYPAERRAAFEQAPEISMAGVESIMTPLPEDAGLMQRAGRGAKGFALGAAGLTTFDPWEFGQMLVKQDPNIGVVQSPEGEFFAVNRATNRVVSLNKLGPSAIDAMQMLATILPSSKAAAGATIPARIGREIGIQSGIEAAQTALGGEFNPEEVALGAGVTAAADVVPQTYRGAREMLARRAPEETGMRRVISEVGEAAISEQPERLTRAVEAIRPDPTLIGAAERLGVEQVVPISVLSGNEQFRAVQAGLTARLGSDLADDQANSIMQLSENVARRLQEYGAASSRGAFDDVIRNRIQDDIASLAEQSNDLYKALDKAVARFGGKFQTVETPIVNSYTNQLIQKYKSIKDMPVGIRNTLERISDPRGISYDALDTLRRTIGENYASALRGANPYPDTNVQSLGQLYDVITQQQNQALQSIVGTRAPEIWGAAKALVAQRKQLEALSIQALGRDLTNDIMPRLEQSLANISRGNIQSFTRKINQIPLELRSQAMVTALKGMMEKNARSADVTKDFVMSLSFYPNWWRQVKSDAKVFNLVTKYLDPEQFKFFDDVARLGGSLQRSIQKQPMNGRLVEFVESFNDSGGLISRLLGIVGRDRGPVGMAARGGSMVFDTMLGATGRGDVMQKMSDLLRDNNFRRLVLRGVEGQPVDRVAERLTQSSAFRNWYNSASESVKSGIQELGRIATQTIPNASAERILAAGVADYFTRSNVDEIEQYFQGEQ